ncbi:hypothetical protein FA95DRAFT_1610536 [Auriscalpium vulgare]|uniref:Uncharacterized protein n=1 Tax=Auriscalpium vulgare TaxID=40419 RepID=A0ACB8RD88_9AGAM|nr:hypothetical protein FA95DRAFT_1610536 [Auriscalpium vulgare]
MRSIVYMYTNKKIEITRVPQRVQALRRRYQSAEGNAIGLVRLTLTELKLLEIQEDVGYLGLSAFLLERLDLPFSARIRMSMATTDLLSNATAWIALIAHLNVIDSALVRFGGFECVHIIGGPRAGVVHAWTSSTSSTIGSRSPSSGLPPEDAKLAFRFQWLPCFIDRIGKRFRSTAFLRLPDFCQRLPFNRVRSLSFGEDRHHDPVPAGRWERLLSSFPAPDLPHHYSLTTHHHIPSRHTIQLLIPLRPRPTIRILVHPSRLWNTTLGRRRLFPRVPDVVAPDPHARLPQPAGAHHAREARDVAKSVQRFIQEHKNRAMEEESEEEWMVGPQKIDLFDLVLIRLDHVSRGSWQPLPLRR